MSSTSSFSEHFSHHNIPFGIGSSDKHKNPQAVTRINDTIIFLAEFFNDRKTAIEDFDKLVLKQVTLNEFAALPRQTRKAVRQHIQIIAIEYGLEGFPDESKEHYSNVRMHLPIQVGDFIDCSCSMNHILNAGRIIGKSEKTPPLFQYAPIAYHGRAGTIVVSGTPIQRPSGYVFGPSRPSDHPAGPSVIYTQSKAMDYELELAAVIGKPLPMGEVLKATEADEHIFGFAVLNDWSARDIQALEMPPLGPFNGKSLGTTLSPWIVTLEALQPFRTGRTSNQDKVFSQYMRDSDSPMFDITMQVEVVTESSAHLVGKSNVQTLHWSPGQMIAHAVSSGSSIRTGDVIATGTVSGSEKGSFGCLLESTEGGTNPIEFPDGSKRVYLEDNDVVRMTAYAGNLENGVGFGECVGRLIPAHPAASLDV